jgi:hypothetical protein
MDVVPQFSKVRRTFKGSNAAAAESNADVLNGPLCVGAANVIRSHAASYGNSRVIRFGSEMRCNVTIVQRMIESTWICKDVDRLRMRRNSRNAGIAIQDGDATAFAMEVLCCRGRSDWCRGRMRLYALFFPELRSEPVGSRLLESV